ncbi:MAG: DNA adenine methylase [Chloroflexi bacterium]|nr:DNA adenine methylase [Chloroflexota bacterium]
MEKEKNKPKRVSEVQTSYILNFVEVSKIAKPFLKWAGGKGQLLDTLDSLLPVEIRSGEIKKYAEPFIGGGAFFFHVAQNYPDIGEFFISDVNPELILVYKTIQSDVENLILQLEEIELEYHDLSDIKQKKFFYNKRDEFNKNLTAIDLTRFQSEWVTRAAVLIFLNRTCFNGLFRVNSKGAFNVPFGDHNNPKICDAANLRSVSLLLQKTRIECGEFEISKDFIDDKTFVYFDPPYRPLSKTSNFNSYSRAEFGDEAQKRLAKYFATLSSKGAKLMLSNSEPKNEDPHDLFFEELYKGFKIEIVLAARNINSGTDKRGKIKELVITNY